MGRIKYKDRNLLDLVPVQIQEWERKEDGTVYLKTPKTGSKWLMKMLLKFGVSPYCKIHLDAFGSYVWECCDGSRRVDQIGQNLKDKFGESVEPVYERLGAFIKLLAHHNFIVYKTIRN